MNYLKIYYQLIEKRKKTPPLKDFEKHHILPKSLFPKFAKDKQNLVKLTYREHYLAHHLLYLHYKSIGDTESMIKMGYALRLMCKNKDGLHISFHEYEEAKKIDKSLRKIAYKGEKNPFYGKHLSDESKKKMKSKLKGRKVWNKGLKMTKETIEKLRNSHLGKNSPNKGRIYVNNGSVNKIVFSDQIPLGFVKGKLNLNK